MTTKHCIRFITRLQYFHDRLEKKLMLKHACTLIPISTMVHYRYFLSNITTKNCRVYFVFQKQFYIGNVEIEE